MHPDPLKLGVEGAKGVCAPGSGEFAIEVDALRHGGDYLWAVGKTEATIKRCLRWAASELDRSALDASRSALELRRMAK